MNIIKKENYRVPVFSWCRTIEENAMKQIDNLAQLPFVFNKISIMSDCHSGYGMPIGGVMATKNAIVPNAAGKDIGCGVCAVKTSLADIDTAALKKIMGEIRKRIPVGFEHHKKAQETILMPKSNWLEWGDSEVGIAVRRDMLNSICVQEYRSALKQIGTLGGGNHFVEIQKGTDGFIWIMLHSGSRNLGLKIADYYNDLAIRLNEKWHSQVPMQWKLAFLPVDTDEGQAYLLEMNYAVDFALANRKLMMDRILNIIEREHFVKRQHFNNNGNHFEYEPMINIAHNYISLENQYGENVWVHRKGATLARKGTIGIIPGSLGSPSYIVKGKGNKESFESCSHGAGRRMGRKEACRTLNLEDEIEKLNKQGIIHGIRGQNDLDEATSAYKNIDDVMSQQLDLVEIMIKLQPLASIKG